MYFSVGKVLFAFAIFISVPLNINPMRTTLLECLNKKDDYKVFFISSLII
jgi:hypothetical protein